MTEIIQFLSTHWMLSSLLGVLILAYLANEMREKMSVPNLPPLEVVQQINHQDALVIDIRPATAFSEGHIVGSHNIPLAEVEKKLSFFQKNQNKPIILVCNQGVSVEKAHSILKQNGIKTVILAGGLQAWRQASLPLTKK